MQRLFLSWLLGWSIAAAADLKPRVIVLTDLKRTHETDDTQSLVRLLAHADFVEVEGIVVTSGHNYWKPEHAVDGYAYAFELLRAYERSVRNLMKMVAQTDFLPVETRQAVGYWPSPHYLVQRTVLGTARQGLDRTGPGLANDGSRLITSVIDEPDDRPVYLLVWGGPNVLAQTLRDLTESPLTRREPTAVAAFLRKLRVVAIGDQDQPWSQRRETPVANNAGRWLRRNYPDLAWIWLSPGDFMRTSSSRQAFYQAHIQGHGALGNVYPDHSNGVEGDTPSLFFVLPLGYGDPEHPEWGSPAGLFVRGRHAHSPETVVSNQLQDREEVRLSSREMVEAAVDPLWNLFAARMDWARSGTGNRPPRVVLNGEPGWHPVHIAATPGATVILDASQTRDDEQDDLRYSWQVLALPHAYRGSVSLAKNTGPSTSLTAPPDAAGREIHVLLAVTDDGAGHHLTAWRRAVVQVKSAQP